MLEGNRNQRITPMEITRIKASQASSSLRSDKKQQVSPQRLNDIFYHEAILAQRNVKKI